MTLELLHLEYLEQQPDGYQYTQFCEHYRQWLRRRGATMRQVHRAGEKIFVDYSGKKPCIWDATTGEQIEVELFVAVLGASNLHVRRGDAHAARARLDRRATRAPSPSSAACRSAVCDQLKSGVTVSCRYEPGIQRTYEEMARTTARRCCRRGRGTRATRRRSRSPCRSRSGGSWRGCATRRIFSLDSLNARIAELLEDLNGRTMRVYQVEPARALREARALGAQAAARRALRVRRLVARAVNIDYHVEVDGHYYSVPRTHRRRTSTCV